jgi:2-methylcitrate dehydratase PrpD
MTKTAIEIFGSWVASVTVSDLPADVLAKAQDGLVDTLGVALAGSRHPAAGPLGELIDDLAGKREATLLGGLRRSSAALAALHNSYLAHVLDFDDTHLDAIVHVNTPVFGAALALAEVLDSSGEDLMAAYAAGLEISSRVGIASGRGGEYGWHLTGLAGAFGATAAGCRLLRLTAAQSANALALASTLTSGLRVHRGTMTKAMSPANAAHNGVVAALAGRRDFTANVAAFEPGPNGFLESHGRDSGVLTDGIGDDFHLLDWEAKPYPCGVVIHPAIDAMLAVRDAIGDLESVSAISLRTSPLALSITGNVNPRDGLGSKFSVYHAAALALVVGNPGVEHFTDAWAVHPDVIAIRDKTEIRGDESLSRDEAAVRIQMADGEVIEQKVHARGTRRRRMDRDAVVTKFLTIVSPVLGPTAAHGLVDAAFDANNLANIDPILRLCTPEENAHVAMSQQ